MTNLRNKEITIDRVTRIGKAIDHPLRVRALAALREGELCVCELVELFGLAPSTISKHMSVIADAGLVERRRAGQWTYYALPEDPEGPIARAIEIITLLADGDPSVIEDRAHLSALHCCTAEQRG